MNEKAVLMCFNIPRNVSEEHIYELFCNAGPIDCIHFGKSGRSVFIVYEFKEAVATAKEIFKNVRLYGKLIRMFDRDDIDDIHAKQEEELLRKRRYEVDNDHEGPAMKQHRYHEYPGHSREFRRNPHPADQVYSNGSSYQESPGFHSEDGSTYREKYAREQDYQNPVSIPNRDFSQPAVSPNILGFRPDLLPNMQPYARDSHRRGYDSRVEESGLRNPYEKPVSRNDYRDRPHRHEDFRDRKYDKPYDRRDYRNHRSRSPPSRNQYRNHGHQNYKARRY